MIGVERCRHRRHSRDHIGLPELQHEPAGRKKGRHPTAGKGVPEERQEQTCGVPGGVVTRPISREDERSSSYLLPTTDRGKIGVYSFDLHIGGLPEL